MGNLANWPFDRASAAPQRVLVIGVVGSGKTTFAKRLGSLTGLARIRLDGYRFRPVLPGLQ